MKLRFPKASLLLLFLLACHSPDSGQATKQPGKAATHHFPEGAEQGSKGSYAAADVALASGAWRLEDAMIGRTEADVKQGSAAFRIKPGGSVTTTFELKTNHASVSAQCADYGKDEAAVLAVFYSTDGGRQWQQAGYEAPAGHALQAVSFPVPAGKPLRLRFSNTGSGRLNVDDISLDGVVATPSQTIPATNQPVAPIAGRDDNMALGNPSGATTSAANKDNYLLVKPQYTLSYNNPKGMANWVSWHLSEAWMGSADRCNCFAPDAALPKGFFKALASQYLGAGFDRGHLCPSADRSASAADNAATFLMSNMSPQSPQLNQHTWERLEDYCRKLTEHGMELYIIAGGYGTGGTGSSGSAGTIAGGAINVPSHFWKIVVVLPEGDNDLQRINKDTRVIAVDMPNVPSVTDHNWNYYQTSVAGIEQATGYHFFTALPADVQAALRQKGGR